MSIFELITKPLRDAAGKAVEVAKDAPVFVLQTALSGVGQVLQAGEKVRETVRRLTGEDGANDPPGSANGPAKSSAKIAEPEPAPARREPVIFAPRPEKKVTEKKTPQPVIFTPADRRDEADISEADIDAFLSELDGVAEIKDPQAAAKAPAEKAAHEAAETLKPSAPRKPKDTAPKPKRGRKPVEPIAGFAELTVGSLRARMRGKTAEQIRTYLEYEKVTAGRIEVIRMFENRLAKMEGEG